MSEGYVLHESVSRPEKLLMPDYSIDPSEHWDDECAFCGTTDDLVQVDVSAANEGGTTLVPGCRSCNSSMRSQTLEQWLSELQGQDLAKWQEIFEWQKWKQTSLAALVRQASKESV